MDSFFEHDRNVDEIALACYVPPKGGTPIHKNRSHHGLAFHLGGECSYVFDDGLKLNVKANDLIYLPKHSNYTVERNSDGGCYAINFDIKDEENFKPFLHRAKHGGQYLDAFKKAEGAWLRKNDGYEMLCKAQLYLILLYVIRERKMGYISKNKSELLQPAIEYIHNEYTKDNIQISRLAELCGMSEVYFRKIFSQVEGMPPLKYINNLKIQRAKELLASKMYTIGEVAMLSGFHDDSYFSREFRKYVKTSPKMYAREIEQ